MNNDLERISAQSQKFKQKKAGWKYLLLALGAFAGLGIEALYAFVLEPLIYGRQLQDFTIMQNISHWILTCITWGLIAFLLIYLAKKKTNFDVFTKTEKLKVWQWIAVAVLVICAFILSCVNWNGCKVIKEFQFNGLLKFIFQYIYYMFETLLFTLIIVFGQKAFEQWTEKKNIPYGGIFCAMTWGLVHVLTKSSLSTGLYSALIGFLFGVVYLLTNRDIKKTYIISYIMFVL